MATGTHVRPGYRTVTAGLNLEGPEEFVAWATNALGAEPGMRVASPDGRLLHGEIRIGDTTIAFDRASRDPATRGAVFHVYVVDADAAYERALKAGSKAKMPPADMFWGERVAVVDDPFGNTWGLATFQREPSQDELERGAAAMAARMAAG